jgi:hypothetical protein
MDEHFESDVGEKRGGEGDCELNGEFEKRAEMNFIVDESQHKQCNDTTKDNFKMGGFAEEAGGVNGYGGVEAGQSARRDEEFYNEDACREERQDCCDDGGASAQGDDGAMVSVFGGAGDEAGACGEIFDKPGENGRERE